MLLSDMIEELKAEESSKCDKRRGNAKCEAVYRLFE